MMDVTRLSTKGQIIIPKAHRSGYGPGSAFVVSRIGDLIVLKPITGLNETELGELEAVDRAWDEIESGKGSAYSEEAFFERLS
jgi:bifunctional DNA-binding transcriptional regulator/antitoxin component of YhaV-PrlF toxin-antitoxin module